MTASVGFVLMFLGKALIVALSGWIAYLIIMNSAPLKSQVFSPAFPIVVVVMIAYLLASIFLSLFSFSSTTILHCFILDSELQEKGGKNGGHTPQSLQPFIDKNNEINAKEREKERKKDAS
jgi:hypothetical protein